MFPHAMPPYSFPPYSFPPYFSGPKEQDIFTIILSKAGNSPDEFSPVEDFTNDVRKQIQEQIDLEILALFL